MNNTKNSVLIIEDNPGDQVLLQENLLSTNLSIENITIANTLAEGMNLLATRNFSLIFLDLFLPDSNGLESFEELINNKGSIPVIIFSGLSDTTIALKAISLGAQDFLIKGDYTLSLLEKTVRYSIERKKNQDALQASNERYNFISRATNDMVWDWDLISGEIHRNSDGWRKIFRTPPDAVTGNGTKEDWISKIHPDDRISSANIIEELLNSDSQELFEMEFRILRDDDTIGYIHDRGFISRNSNGKPIRLIGACQDITERKIAEQLVSSNEQRFKSLVQNSADLLAILNTEGNYTYVSPTSKKILGFEPEYFLGKNAFSFIHEDDLEKMVQYFSLMNSESFAETPLFRFMNSSGEWRWIQSSITNLLHEPSVNGIVVNSRDVTDAKIAADEIEKLSLVAKNTLSGVFLLNAERRIEWINNAFTTITGFTTEDVMGKTPLEFLYGADPDPVQFADLREKIYKGLSYEGERLYYTKSGKPIWVWLQLQPLFNDQGEIKQYFGVQTDITEKKRADTELSKLSLIARETINGVVILDNNHKVIWINNAFTKICGYKLEDVTGKSSLEFFDNNDSDETLVSEIKEQIKKQQPFVFEKLNYNKTGGKVFMRVQMQPVFDTDGSVKQFFALITDITKERQLEERIQEDKAIKQKQITEAVFSAQESERSEIGRELHDNVNQLLGAARLYIDMGKNEGQEQISLLTSASGFIKEAIEEIRKLSKTLITPLIKEIGLIDSIKDLTEEIMLVHPINIKLTIKNFNECGLDEKFKLTIFRIIQEQITNILKHAKALTIDIVLEDNSGNLLISIADNGIGFDTNMKKSGVGITNIKSRSDLYNGNVALISKPGTGTSLSVSFDKKDLIFNNKYSPVNT